MEAPATPSLSPASSRLGVAVARLKAALGKSSRARAMIGSFATVAGLTVAAKGVSFVKDAIVADRFGAGDTLDAFLLAFGLAAFAATVLAGGLPEAFLPLHAELMHQRGAWRAQRLALQCTACHVLSLVVAAILIGVFASELVSLTGRGFPPGKQAISVHCLRALLPFLVLQGVTVHLATWLRAGRSFALATVAPALVPLTIVLSLLVFGRAPSLRALYWGTDLGSVLAVAALAWALSRAFPVRKKRLWRKLLLWEPASSRVLGNAFPFLLSGVIFSSSAMVDQAMASWLESGSLVVLGYSDKICGLVLGLTAAPASDALFPYFAEAVARRDWRGVRRQMFGSAGTILLFATPMALGLCALAPWLVHLLFERGAFDAAAVQRVAGVLRFAALQLPFYITGTLISSIVVSMQATRLMLALSVGAVLANAGLNWILMQWLGIGGIALSTALVHLLSTGVLCWWVLRVIDRRLAEDGGAAPAAARGGKS